MLMMFRLNVFYLPTLKQVVGHYKSSKEVMFWFTQMMCYHQIQDNSTLNNSTLVTLL